MTNNRITVALIHANIKCAFNSDATASLWTLWSASRHGKKLVMLWLFLVSPYKRSKITNMNRKTYPLSFIGNVHLEVSLFSSIGGGATSGAGDLACFGLA